MADDSPSIWDQINGAMNDGTILNAISNPLTSGLAAMAKSFGESSMPTRMPTPFMAALGKATGSALEGVGQGQALQKQGLANRQQQILQDWFKSRYPSGTGNAGGSPMGMPGAGGGQNYNGMYLNSPADLSAKGDLAMMSGQDRAAATLYGMPNQMANQGVAMGLNGAAIAVPGAAEIAARKARLVTGSEKAAGADYDAPKEYTVPLTNPDGTPILGADGKQAFGPRTMTAQQANMYFGHKSGGESQGGTLPVSADDPFPNWARKINGGENSTGNPNARNPLSSATGNGQFIDGTWPGVIRAVRPDIAAGKTDKELLGLRGSPGLAQSATEQYARQNAADLANSGLPVNGGTLALSHFLGPAGAKAVLRATPSAPIEMLPGMAPVVASNPQLRGMTAGALVQQYQKRMGGETPLPVQPSQPAAPPQNMVAGPGAPVATPTAATPTAAPVGIQPPGVAGPEKPTAEQEAAIAVRKAREIQDQSLIPKAQTEVWQHAAQKDAEIVNDAFKKAATGAPALATTATIRSMLPDVTTGKSADARLLTTQWAAALGIPEAKAKEYFGTNPVMGELLQKKLFELSTGAVRSMGAREPGSVIGMFQKNYPNMDSRNTTIDAMTRLLDMDQIRNQDYAASVQGYHNESVKQLSPTEGYRGLSGFESQFDKTNPPKVYVGAALAAGGLPFKDWTHSLSPQEQVAALRLAERVYPDAAPMNKDGMRHPLVRAPVQGAPNGG